MTQVYVTVSYKDQLHKYHTSMNKYADMFWLQVTFIDFTAASNLITECITEI